MMRTAILAVVAVLFLATECAAWRCGNLNCFMCYGGTSRYRGNQWSSSSSNWTNSAWNNQNWQDGVVTEKAKPVKPKPTIASTPQRVVDEMLRLAELTTEDIVYDLGCGDGRVVKTAAKRWGCFARGIEIDPEVAKIARENCKGLTTARIIEGDIRKFNYRRGSVFIIYQEMELMREVLPKLSEARLVISGCHPIPGMRNREVLVDGKYPVYLASPSEPAVADDIPAPEQPASQGKWQAIVLATLPGN
jgi:SAM-dependent methyltransferase